ncbi:hypothetical protein [Borrelia coriaceae]|nr:hypothetical protein [Borrelia coriaceae]
MIKNSFLVLSNIMIKRISNISMFIILLGINTKVFATYYHKLDDGKSALVLTYNELTEKKRGQCVVIAENNLDIKIDNVRNELKSDINDLDNKIEINNKDIKSTLRLYKCVFVIIITMCLAIFLTLMSVLYTLLNK